MASAPASGEEGSSTTPLIPAIAAFSTCGALAMGFGAGYGTRTFYSSEAYKDLIEKFPEQPTAEMEAMARRTGFRALAAGTGLATLMGVGAVLTARAYGITTIAHLGDEARRWLPTTEQMRAEVTPKIEPLQRSLSRSLQPVRDSAGDRFQQSQLGSYLQKKAMSSSENSSQKELQPWEKELLAKLRALEEADAKQAQP
eukprot:scaffold12848_cov140-Isochrysis_galbana.AAC.6